MEIYNTPPQSWYIHGMLPLTPISTYIGGFKGCIRG